MKNISVKHQINDTVLVPLVGKTGQVIAIYIDRDGIEQQQVRYTSNDGTVVDQYFRSVDLVAA